MDYLTLCRAFVQELGIAGGGSANPSAVTGQTGELLNVVNWIAASEEQINNHARDWKYLWTPFTDSMAVTDQEPTMPGPPRARAWKKNTFWLDRNLDTQRKLVFRSWEEFERMESIPTEALSITLKPDGQLRLDAPLTAAQILVGEYYKAPTRMTANADTPPMPDEYHRIVLCRAAVIYGGREDAPEIVTHYEAEYIEILSHLEADQRPQREQEDDAEAYLYQEQTIPGFELEGENFFERSP